MKNFWKGFPRLKMRISGKYMKLGRRGISVFLLLLLAVAPVVTVFATANTAGSEVEGDFGSATGRVIKAIGSYLSGEYIRAAMPEEHEDKTAAIAASLINFGHEVLRDEALASVLDEIIWDLLDDEKFREGIRNKQELISEIIRDERLVQVLSEVIAEYLQNPRLAGDIKIMFEVVRDLLADEDMHYLIRDALAAFLEDPGVERMINRLILELLNESYGAVTSSLADFLADERVAAILEEGLVQLAVKMPDLAAGLINNQEILNLTADLMEVCVGYGYESTVSLLADPRFRELMAELIVLSISAVPLADMGADIAGYSLPKIAAHLTAKNQNIGEGLTGTMLDKITVTLVDELFKRGEYQEYFNDSFTFIMIQAGQRAQNLTPYEGRNTLLPGTTDNLRAMVANSIAPVPPELIRDAFFRWLVFGGVNYDDDLDPQPRTFRQWALDLTGLLTAARCEALSDILVNVILTESRAFLEEHGDDITTALRSALSCPDPWNRVVQEILANQGDLEAAAEVLVKRIVGNLPLDILAAQIRQELQSANLDDIVRESVKDIPLAEAEAMLREGRRVQEILTSNLSPVSLAGVAQLIRNDESIVAALGGIISGFPVETVIDFIQDEQRALLIGETLAHTLLNLAADFIEEERMGAFAQLSVLEMVNAIDDSPGAVLLGSIARFLENEDFSRYLAGAINEFVQGVNRELADLYKLVVSSFFTRFIWKFI